MKLSLVVALLMVSVVTSAPSGNRERDPKQHLDGFTKGPDNDSSLDADHTGRPLEDHTDRPKRLPEDHTEGQRSSGKPPGRGDGPRRKARHARAQSADSSLDHTDGPEHHQRNYTRGPEDHTDRPDRRPKDHTEGQWPNEKSGHGRDEGSRGRKGRSAGDQSHDNSLEHTGRPEDHTEGPHRQREDHTEGQQPGEKSGHGRDEGSRGRKGRSAGDQSHDNSLEHTGRPEDHTEGPPRQREDHTEGQQPGEKSGHGRGEGSRGRKGRSAGDQSHDNSLEHTGRPEDHTEGPARGRDGHTEVAEVPRRKSKENGPKGSPRRN